MDRDAHLVQISRLEVAREYSGVFPRSSPLEMFLSPETFIAEKCQRARDGYIRKLR